MYRIANGHDNEAGFVVVSPQPRSPGILATSRDDAIDGTKREQGQYVIWEFSVLTDSEYSSLLTQFGLSTSTLTNDVTIRTRANDRSLVNKNGTIVLPEQGQDASREMAFWRNIRFLIINLSDT